ncbi:hypothetical protein LCGC14_1729070 [marine sediment metagenome]|uniref:Uncharacterized protein n=1 Tax=marine sediment metagenome TaxID=412755 RepID=A0A0F9H9V6_9ZZZZ
MRVMNKVETETGKVFINIILTEKEVDQLEDGETIKIDDENLNVQIVGYGGE